jgi:rare lipoprotein A
MAFPRRAAWALLPTLVLLSCARTPPPQPQPRYLVGEPYAMGGVWSYPREEFALVATGLASVAADARAGRRTTNGEIHDPAALTAAHRTLQLPAILEVTNLETGLQVQVRLNDRGPAAPGRVVELSRRAGQLLGVAPGRPAQVRIAVVTEPSRALAAGLPQPDAPRLEIAAAPVAGVSRETLAPPPGATQAAQVRQARAFPGGQAATVAQPSLGMPPARMPEAVTRIGAAPGRLFLEAATFSRRDAAERQAARMFGTGARVEQVGGRGRGGGTPQFRVRAGPFGNVAEADRALEQAIRAGVSEARIIVD